MKVFSIIILASTILVLARELYGQSCTYDRDGYRDAPYGHMRVETRASSVKQMVGQVLDQSGEPLVEAIVVVKRLQSRSEKYIGSQKTDGQGRFCFRGLPGGTYQVGAGAPGFNGMLVTVNVNPKMRKNYRRILTIELPVGT